MAGVGQSRRFDGRPTTSDLPSEADIVMTGRDVANVPTTDIAALAAPYMRPDASAPQSWS